jgi:hypothetical protein
MKIKSIYNKCFKAIDGSKNEDVIWYSSKRPKTISRSSFFEAAVFAIWVSGLRRKSADSFLKRAEENGFEWDFQQIAEQTPKQWEKFKTSLHGESIPKRAGMKWDAIQYIAKEVNKCKDDTQFRNEWFDGKSRSSGLNNQNVKSLKKRKLPFIGPANSHFIIRNMGGEAIKCDRWLEAFMNYFEISESHLLKSLKKANIPAGLFDLVIWAYCEKFIQKTKQFDNCFRVISNN